MEKARKKEVAREYRERKQQQGIFAVRCASNGETWLGSTPNLDTQRNGLWFQLRLGNYINKALQAAWKRHGEAAFSYEILEEVSDGNTLLIPSLLKEREAIWREKLAAAKLIG